MHQDIFFFDSSRFQQEAKPFIYQADKGNYEAVIEKARSIIERTLPEEWILEGLGAHTYELETCTGPAQTGFAFLVLLAECLFPDRFVYRVNSTSLLLSCLHWSERDTSLFSLGMATTYLIKPEQIPDPLQRPPAGDSRWEDPTYYWWWIRPLCAYNTGWLAYEQVCEFYRRLASTQRERVHSDVATFDIPPNCTVTQQNLIEDYYRLGDMLRTAMESKQGLFYNWS